MRKKFWKIKNSLEDQDADRVLTINGAIAEESWFDDDVTPQLFKNDLNAGDGPITVWINSPGGDVTAAASIYNLLTDYNGRVTVKIDGLAASAASVIAMAGDRVLMSPVSMMMIHNPAAMAMGDKDDLEKTIDMLNEVKESIINAYAAKTGLSRSKLSKLMDDETWMDTRKAIELGFCDDVLTRRWSDEEKKPDEDEPDEDDPNEENPDEDNPDQEEPDEDDSDKDDKPKGFIFRRYAYDRMMLNKMAHNAGANDNKYKRLALLKKLGGRNHE